MLVSAPHQHESARGMSMSPWTLLPLPTPSPSGLPQSPSLSGVTQQIPPGCVLDMWVCMRLNASLPICPSRSVSTILFCVSTASPANKVIRLYEVCGLGMQGFFDGQTMCSMPKPLSGQCESQFSGTRYNPWLQKLGYLRRLPTPAGPEATKVGCVWEK